MGLWYYSFLMLSTAYNNYKQNINNWKSYTFFKSGKIALNSFPLRKFTAVSFCKISLKVLLLRLLLGWLLFAVVCDVWLFLLLAISPQTGQWSVNSCAIDQSFTPFLKWRGGGCLLQKSQQSVFSHLVSIPMVCNRAGWDQELDRF